MNHPFAPDSVGRRTFLRRAALGGLTAVTLVLASRAAARGCINDGTCPGCPIQGECDLPKAVARRRALGSQPGRTP
jgi:hypothetical protein